MIRILLLAVVLFLTKNNFSQSLQPDTFTYTINLDLSQNLYLKTIPVDLLKGYCEGKWNAYYPKFEMTQCLFDDFLQHYDKYQITQNKDNFCANDYCSNPYFVEFYKQFGRKIKFKEVVYFDMQHQTEKREIVWLQVFYSRLENEVWIHYGGPIFYFKELNASYEPIQVYNKSLRSISWSLDKEFSTRSFIVNENPKKTNTKKVIKNYDVQEY